MKYTLFNFKIHGLARVRLNTHFRQQLQTSLQMIHICVCPVVPRSSGLYAGRPRPELGCCATESKAINGSYLL
jgi:hypothetical protein